MAKPQSIKARRLSTFDLSPRARNAVKALGLKTLGQLHRVDWAKVKDLPNCGTKTVNELKELSWMVERQFHSTPDARWNLLLRAINNQIDYDVMQGLKHSLTPTGPVLWEWKMTDEGLG